MILSFGDHWLDTERRELRRSEKLIDIEPKVFDLLVYIVRHRDRVVSKDEMLQSVWQGRIVSDSALTTRINAVRRALGDDGKTQKLIRTFTRKGLRFVGEVTEIPHSASLAGSHRSTDDASDSAGGVVALDHPSIAVLPFDNLNGTPEDDYFVDGMVEEIVTALSRIRWLVIVARPARFGDRRQAADVQQVGRELNCRYVLDGSVRRVGNRIRISGKLIDARTGAHLWADRFDGSSEDIFDLQDKVASSVAGFIEPELQAAETARSARRPTSDLDAYDLYLRAHALFLTSARRIPEALCLMEQAVLRDPQYAPALAWAAVCCFRLILDNRSHDPALDRLKGTDFARRALEADGDDPRVLVNAGLALAYFGEDIGAMLGLVDRALARNPNFARGRHIAGLLQVWAGQPRIALSHLEAALRLSPRTRIGTSENLLGLAHLLDRRFDIAVPKLLLAIQDDPTFPSPYRFLAACYAHLGRIEEAQNIVGRLRAVTDIVVPDLGHLRNPDHREIILSGLLRTVR